MLLSAPSIHFLSVTVYPTLRAFWSLFQLPNTAPPRSTLIVVILFWDNDFRLKVHICRFPVANSNLDATQSSKFFVSVPMCTLKPHLHNIPVRENISVSFINKHPLVKQSLVTFLNAESEEENSGFSSRFLLIQSNVKRYDV